MIKEVSVESGAIDDIIGSYFSMFCLKQPSGTIEITADYLHVKNCFSAIFNGL